MNTRVKKRRAFSLCHPLLSVEWDLAIALSQGHEYIRIVHAEDSQDGEAERDLSPVLPALSGDALEPQGGVGSEDRWLYSQDTCHRVKCTTSIFSPAPLALLPKEDPLSPS